MYRNTPYGRSPAYNDLWSTLAEAGVWVVEHRDEIEAGLEVAGEVRDLTQQAQADAAVADAEAKAAEAEAKALQDAQKKAKDAEKAAKKKAQRARKKAAAQRALQRRLKREAAAASQVTVPFFYQPKVWWSVAGVVGVLGVIAATRKQS